MIALEIIGGVGRRLHIARVVGAEGGVLEEVVVLEVSLLKEHDKLQLDKNLSLKNSNIIIPRTSNTTI